MQECDQSIVFFIPFFGGLKFAMISSSSTNVTEIFSVVNDAIKDLQSSLIHARGDYLWRIVGAMRGLFWLNWG